MVCIAAPHVPALLEECGRIGARHIHILTSGFNELATEKGRLLKEQNSSIAKEYGLLIIGPNCMGDRTRPLLVLQPGGPSRGKRSFGHDFPKLLSQAEIWRFVNETQ